MSSIAFTNKVRLVGWTFFLAFLVTLTACSSTQKTAGQGMLSVIAQNVVRIAGAKAVRDLQISEVRGKKVHVQLSGFLDDFSKGFVQNLISNHVESFGAGLVDRNQAELIVEVNVNAAGNDRGQSDYLVGSAERTEGSVDLTVVVRDVATGMRISSQTIRGYAKYQQGSFLRVKGSGAYFVKIGNNWSLVEDPVRFK
jgi:hypothetical protein